MTFNCTVISCVRTIEGAKTASSFLIERTCHYAKAGTCTLGKRHDNKHGAKHENTKNNNKLIAIKSMLFKR